MLRPVVHHTWDLAPRDAIDLQRQLADLVAERPLDVPVTSIAGIDVSVRNNRVRTAIVVLDVASLAVIDEAVWEGPAVFPYIPGLLSFREIPAVLPALSSLQTKPDLLMLDGQGRAHPRRFGLACHLGVLFDLPTIGVAKTRLTGRYEEPGEHRGSSSDLMDGDERIGCVLRTRTRVKPVFVSAGHNVSLRDAVSWTLSTCSRFRLPEPTRLAHHLSKSGRLPG